MLTARCENHLHGVKDLDDTIARLQAYVAAGAEVVYAPGLCESSIRSPTVVSAVGVPVNVLILPGGPSVAELGEAGVRRISTGGLLSRISHGAMVAAAERLRDNGVVGHDRAVPVRCAGDAGAARLIALVRRRCLRCGRLHWLSIAGAAGVAR